ncbi:hypothetical protein FJZ33_11190, partial [Candidatus Poribacteria bacterium]|nr:hypothetical protein [Candidatus Poribacteria bacterium]
AFCFDWAYDRLSKEQRDFLVDYINGEIEKNNRGILRADFFLWGNRSVFRMLDVGLAGMATYGDNPKAQEWIDGAYKRFKELTAVEMEIAGEGGGYPEGTVYGAITVMRILQYVEAVLTYSGEDLYSISPWFYDRMAFELLLDYPGFSRNGNYREYPSFGDSERNRYTIADYARISRLMLIHHYPDSDTAKYLQWYLNQRPVDKVNYRYLMGQEFIWYDPDQPQTEPALLSHYAKGTGTVLMRSDWRNDAVYVSFQGGDHLAYHQHLDQNSFTIYKEGDLAIESGVYDGDGLSPHDLQYYARSIAHNSMLIYDPSEVWGNFRGGYAALNDGGQRMMTPAPVVISSAESWKKNRHYYDTADITRFYDSKEMTYIFSNATNAYSSSKVTSFTRQLAYLRPDIIIIFDRVSSTNPAFAKKFLVHFLNEPFINGNGVFVSPGEYLYDGDLTIASVNNSELLIKTLLPENNRIRKVGGRGIKDYYVFGINYKTGGNEYEKDYGEWRIEIEPTIEKKDDIFLNVFYPTKSRENRMPGLAKLDGNNLTGVQIGNNVVLFSKFEIELENAEIAMTGNGLYGFYVADMVAEKPYNIYVDKKLFGTFSATDSN